MDIKSRNVVVVDISTINSNPQNANRHSIEQIKRLEKLITYQGFRNPLIVSNRTNMLVAGHGRLEAALNLGMKQVPVDFQDFDSEEEEYAYLISDNEIARWAELDFQSVYDNLKHLDIEDVDLLGIEDFKVPEIDVFDPQTDEDAVPEVVDPITKRGDVWLLGKHRLMCGDSIMLDDVEKLTQKQDMDMVFTDPPYNVAFNGRSGKHDVIKNDDMKEDDFNNFIDEVCQTIRTINPKCYYIWCNWKFYGVLQGQMDYKSCIVWAKNVFGMGNNYRHQHEFCLFSGDIDKDIKSESDLWNIARDSRYVHPTQKPVALSARAFGNHSTYITVLDLFAGSGSTLIGAEQCGKTSFNMELDERYCDVIIKRWQEYTGKIATLESSGQTYEELKKERL